MPLLFFSGQQLIVLIKKNLLLDLLEAAKNTFPDEFFALLAVKEKNGTIEEFVVVPAVYGKAHTLFRSDLIPFDKKIVGSMHSHPSPNAFPSEADLQAFRRLGQIHLIVAAPFNLGSIRVFDGKGKRTQLTVVD
ncbi:MAG: Mov34/MPN/PAD-1 family protein [Candidatus Diapherotrites archaeon]